MSALPRPDLPPGPHRDLVTELHDLHHRAGWPSLRALARQTGVSHTTVSKTFSAPALPTWGTVELLVEALGGDVDEVRGLWLAATAPSSTSAPSRPRIAGRRADLDSVRRHLQTGTGMLLVTGEAGIGKTTLVEAAAEATDVFIAVGRCLPLSTEVPLLPVVDALRLVHAADDGQWLTASLASCPPYVSTSLSRLVPELAGSGGPEPDDAWGLERLFSSIEITLRALASTRPLSLHLEDCHWADGSTLDLLMRMGSRSVGLPVVATWRSDDPDVSSAHADWLSRARWASATSTIDLAPLSLDETAHQLRLLIGPDVGPDVIRAIHARSRGLPLYTTQLAESPNDPEMPRLLSELLDRRLGDLDDVAWRVARLLGVAQRSLRYATLVRASGMDPAELDAALRALSQRRLLRQVGEDAAGLAHPLFTEAITRRLLPGEAATVHLRLAEALAGEPPVEPGVIAGHWRAGGRPDLEVMARVSAARQAGDRFAHRDELDSSLRVLELWDAGHRPSDIELWEVLARALGSAIALGDYDTGRRLAQRALDLDLPEHARARVLLQAGNLMVHQGEFTAGGAHLDEAVALLERLPPAPALVEVLNARIAFWVQTARFARAQEDAQRALDVLGACEDLRLRRRVLNWSAWLRMSMGDHETALAESGRARAIVLPEPDPLADIFMAINTTDMLLHSAATADQVGASAVDALRDVEVWDLDHTLLSALLRGNVAQAHLQAGDVTAARRCIEPVTRSAPSPATASAHVVLAAIETREGHTDAALRRCRSAREQVRRHDLNWTEGVPLEADIELWTGRCTSALAQLEEALAIVMNGDASRLAAPLLVLTARAHADHLDDTAASPAERRRVSQELDRRITRAMFDPFGTQARDASVPALAASWHAEIARIDGRATIAAWSRAATGWDRLRRPHDAAYSRWRGAQIAVLDGEGSAAQKLLRRAAADARAHVPLSEAIAATRSSA